MDDVLESIRKEWAWAIPSPEQLLAVSKFGNVLIAVSDGSVWRICPEELSCCVFASTVVVAQRLMADPEFREEWELSELVEQAEARHGVQPLGRCFCLKIPGVLGGRYEIDNVGTTTVSEVVACAGDLARQIKDLPDGTRIQFRVE